MPESVNEHERGENNEGNILWPSLHALKHFYVNMTDILLSSNDKRRQSTFNYVETLIYN